MKVPLCTTICNVAPVFVLLQFPQERKPVQNAHFKLSGMNTVVALDKRIPKVVDGEVLKLSQCTIIEVQVIGVAYSRFSCANI